MDRLKEKQELADLLDVYGDLLTERQRHFLELYFNEDLSYGEIAESEQISRQAVHDAIQHGKKSLLHFEEHLSLVRKRSAAGESAANLSEDEWQSLQKKVMELYQTIRREEVIYDTQSLLRKVKELMVLIGAEDAVV